MDNAALAFLLITVAGAVTALGSVAASGFGRKNEKYISAGLAFAAGVLFFTAVAEILPEAGGIVAGAGHGGGVGYVAAAVAAPTLAGFLLMLAMEKILPHDHMGVGRSGVFTAVAVGAHNFPEGMAAFIIATNAPETGIPVIVAIAAHNVPLGMAISIPFFESDETPSANRRKAALCSLAAGMAGPLGAMAGFLIFGGAQAGGSSLVFANLSLGTAGIMVYVAVMELVPAARRGASGIVAALGFFAGAVVLAAITFLLRSI